ncbi:trypco2 family protein [Streptomyces sp. NPDC050549]|uniref:trypco2 family protein n=1 Tax=Streptomyces sp. NPDC050549 TaxID=3155406 RepID=UPI0034269D8D
MSEQESRDITLAQMITALRDSLETAQRDGDSRGGPRFRVEEIEVEATVLATRDLHGSGGVKFWVVNAETGIDRGHCAVQRVLLRLGVDPSLKISRPYVQGARHDLP